MTPNEQIKSIQDVIERWRPMGGLKSHEAMAEIIKIVEVKDHLIQESQHD